MTLWSTRITHTRPDLALSCRYMGYQTTTSCYTRLHTSRTHTWSQNNFSITSYIRILHYTPLHSPEKLFRARRDHFHAKYTFTHLYTPSHTLLHAHALARVEEKNYCPRYIYIYTKMASEDASRSRQRSANSRTHSHQHATRTRIHQNNTKDENGCAAGWERTPHRTTPSISCLHLQDRTNEKKKEEYDKTKGTPARVVDCSAAAAIFILLVRRSLSRIVETRNWTRWCARAHFLENVDVCASLSPSFAYSGRILC